MILEYDFIFFGSLIIMSLLPLYIYRKNIFYFYYEKEDISSFISDLQIYLDKNIPNISFNYDILTKVKDEKDSRIKQTLIIEDMILQFNNYEYSTTTQETVSNTLLWSSYENDSRVLKNRAPTDLIRRKELAWRRDGESCNRCGQKIKLLESHISFAKNIEDGGTYHFENLAILCNDCYRINNSNSYICDLHLENTLMRKALF